MPEGKVDKCTTVKAIAIAKDGTKSDVITNTYFVGLDDTFYKDLPIVTLTIDEDDLFDYDKGIYVKGRIYDESEHEGYPEAYPANYTQKGKKWEREAEMSYFDGNKKMIFTQDIGVRIHGGWSRCFNQKSFNLYAREKYSGSDEFPFDFFNNGTAHTLMLRSGGYRDTFLTKIRDSLDQDFSINEPFSTQRSMPVIAFLNGEYWGIYNLQERFSESYLEEKYSIHEGEGLIIKNDEIDEGEEADYHHYEELKTFFMENDFTNEEAYKEAKKYIDMDEFASYMSTQLYINNIDWPGNNVRMFRRIRGESNDYKWHFMMFDTDDSSNILSYKCHYTTDPFLNSAHWKSGPLDESCILGLMLSKLIKNETFKSVFKSTYQRIGENIFSFDKVDTYLNSASELLKYPMVNNYYRFVSNDLTTYNDKYFLAQVEIIRDFFKNRYPYAMQYLNEHIN